MRSSRSSRAVLATLGVSALFFACTQEAPSRPRATDGREVPRERSAARAPAKVPPVEAPAAPARIPLPAPLAHATRGSLEMLVHRPGSGPIERVCAAHGRAFWTTASRELWESADRPPTDATRVATSIDARVLACDDAALFFAAERTLHVRPRGGEPRTLATLPDLATHLAVDATNVYVAYAHEPWLDRVSRETGTIEHLARVGSAGGIALDAERVYWTETRTGLVRSVAKTGGPIDTIAQSPRGPRGIAVDERWVVWSAEVTGAILRAGKRGRPAATIVSGQHHHDSLSIVDGYVYWCSFGETTGSLVRIPITRGTPQEIVGNLRAPTSFAFTADGRAIVSSSEDSALLVLSGIAPSL